MTKLLISEASISALSSTLEELVLITLGVKMPLNTYNLNDILCVFYIGLGICLNTQSIHMSHSQSALRWFGFRLWPEAHVISALFLVWWYSSYSLSSLPVWRTACRIPPLNPTPPVWSWPETRQNFKTKGETSV